MTRRIAVFCLLAAAFTSLASGQTAPVRSEQDALIQLEHDWDEAFHRNDATFIAPILADEFMVTYGDGSRGDRAKELEIATVFQQAVESSTLDEFTVKIYRDTAVVWFTQHLVGTSQGQKLALTFHYIDVFVFRAGRWQCVASQSTRYKNEGDTQMICAQHHHANGVTSRRRFLGAMAAAGAGALLPNATLLSQTAVSARRLIDVHHHLLPPTFITATQGRFVNPAQITSWSLERALAEMDANGVAMAFSSVTQPGVWLGKGTEAARKLSRECNDYQARVVQDHPGRFGAFAVLPLPDAEGSLRELEYTLDTLKADGIGLLSSYDDKWLGDPLFMPVLEELNRRRAVVYVHPNAPDCCRTLMPSVSPNMIEYPQDSTRAITNLLFTGALNRLRDVRFIFSHGGGTLPMLAGRIAQLATPRDLEKIPNGVEAELKRLYYEIANTAHRPAIAALKEVAPISQIMFGTDFPFVPIKSTADGMTRVGLSAAEQRAIGFENASALLPRARQRTSG